MSTGRRAPEYAALVAVTALAIAIRVVFVLWMAATPGFEWIDPDGYLYQGRILAEGQVLDAFRYEDFFKAPLYPFFLSLFAHLPGMYPLNAAIGQAVLGGLAAGGVLALARRVAGERIAVGAAIVYAFYFPSVMSLMTFMQERVYIPLVVMAMTVLVAAVQDHRGRWALAAAGACLGVAALARSMPVYFTCVATAWLVWSANERAAGVRRSAFLPAGFALVTLPYVWWISTQAGRLVVIEDIGAYGLARLSPDGVAYFDGTMPTLLTTASFLWQRLASAPLAYARELLAIVSGMFQAPGGSWLAEHGHVRWLWQATLLKLHAHIGGDLVLAACAGLAPVGVVLARARPGVQLVALWVGVHLLLTAVAGYGGERFRQPVDFALVVLASAAIASRWRDGRWWTWVVALALAAPIALGLGPSLDASLAARADYGVLRWDVHRGARTAELSPQAGFNLTPPSSTVDLELSRPGAPTRVTISVRGVTIAESDIDGTPRRIGVPHGGGRVFVEIAARDGSSAGPIVVHAPGLR